MFVAHERLSVVDHQVKEVRDVFRDDPDDRATTIEASLMDGTGRKMKDTASLSFGHEKASAASRPEREDGHLASKEDCPGLRRWIVLQNSLKRLDEVTVMNIGHADPIAG